MDLMKPSVGNAVRNIFFGFILIYLGFSLGGFFWINYVIGVGGILLGVWQYWKYLKFKKQQSDDAVELEVLKSKKMQ